MLSYHAFRAIRHDDATRANVADCVDSGRIIVRPEVQRIERRRLSADTLVLHVPVV